MKFYRFLFVLGVWWTLSTGVGAIDETWAGETGSTIISVDQPIHFLGIDGSDILLGAGSYTVEAAESWLRLVPEFRRSAVLIKGEPLTHGEVLESSIAKVHVIDSDARQVELLLRDGTGLQAMGTVSGTLPRGVPRTNSRPQVRSAQNVANSQATNIVVPPIEKERIKVFQPKDLNDKVLMDLVQMLIDRSQSLEKKLEQQRQKLEALSQSHHTHRHNYEVTISGTEGEKSFITIGMLQNLLENYDAGHASKGHIFKKGAMFGLKYDVKSYSKETSTPK